MWKSTNIKAWITIFFWLIFSSSVSADVDGCEGRYPNPLTDVCWLCIFPINIGGIPITAPNQRDNRDPSPPLICSCPAPPPIFIRYGVGISFWEPARVSEVVRQPFCSPTLNGIVLGNGNAPRGDHSEPEERQGQAFYHVHWIQYPILNWLGMAITEGACFINETFDVAYMSELDPLWDEDELSFLINPEAALFANPIAQAACVADSAMAAATRFGIDELFWCSGSQGSLFPLSGSHANHIGGIDTSMALTHTMIYKLHRQTLAQDTSTAGAMCGSQIQPILRKNQYKTNLMYPIPWAYNAYGFGASSVVWGAGKEFPYRGEDFSYMVWRKRTCCAY